MFKNTKMLKRLTVTVMFAFALSLGIVCLEPMQAEASTLSQYQAQQKKIKSNLAAKQQEIKNAKNSISAYQAQLKTVNANLSAAQDQLAAVNASLEQAKVELAQTEAELKGEQDNLETQVDAYSNRLRENYIDGNVSLLDVVLQSTSMEDFITRSYYMEKILEYDNNMIDVINESIDKIEKQKAVQEQQKADMESLKSAKESAVAELQTAQAEKQSLISTAQAEKAQAEDEYDAMLADSNALTSEINSLIAKQKAEAAQQAQQNNSGNSGGSSGGNYQTGTGSYGWPLPSSYRNITSNYGMRMHPTKHVYKMHTGIDISAPGGTSIYAADSGTVILSRYYGSYGNCVIVDHGGGVVTLYAHMRSTAVSAGQSVKRGQTIGYVGSTGASTGNHLHFEVRRGGSCVSPWGYVN
ncbi:MAG: murein hydrolase activator EnvC family protein [Bacillota bacterium]|jgi:murein DD-endopeptidase MepM/ murein hydrolase activator NlpD